MFSGSYEGLASGDTLQFHFSPLEDFAWRKRSSGRPLLFGFGVSLSLAGGRVDLGKGDAVAVAQAVALDARLERLRPALVVRSGWIWAQRGRAVRYRLGAFGFLGDHIQLRRSAATLRIVRPLLQWSSTWLGN